MPRVLRHPLDNLAGQRADGNRSPLSHDASSLRVPTHWTTRDFRPSEPAGRMATEVGRPATGHALEVAMSDRALALGVLKYPFHTNKLIARDADTTTDTIKSARRKGSKLHLRHVLMLVRTWGPDVWEAIFEPVDEALAAAARDYREAQKTKTQEAQKGDDNT